MGSNIDLGIADRDTGEFLEEDMEPRFKLN